MRCVCRSVSYNLLELVEKVNNFTYMKKEKKDKHFIHKPIYKGGREALRTFVQKNLRYPAEARAAGVTGSVHLRYSIDFQGQVTEVKVIAGLGFGCDEEAVRVIKLLKFDVPKNRRRRIQFHKKIAVHFRTEEHDVPIAAKVPPAPVETPNYQYTITAATPAKPTTTEPDKKNPPKGNSYSYSVTW